MKKLLVLAFAALLLIAYSVPVMAEVKIGGIVFTDFYYINRNKESGAIYEGTNGQQSYNNTRIEVPGMTRLYARWTNEDNVGMYIEYGLGGSKGSSGVTMRHAYGWWDMSPMFQLMAGHSTTPFSPLFPSQLMGMNDNSLNVIGMGYGEFYSGRFVQVRGTFRFSKAISLAVALVDPNGGTQYVNAAPAGITPQDYQDNTKIPRIDAGASIDVGPVSIKPSVLWSQRTFDKTTTQAQTSTLDDKVGVYAASLGVRFGMGPFKLEAEGQYGKNWGNTYSGIGANPTARNSGISLFRPTLTADYALDDTTCWSYWVDLAFKFGAITPHLIVGQQNVSGDKNPMSYQSLMYGVSVPIQLAKGFSVRPEIMFYDDGNDNTAWSNGTATQPIGQSKVDAGSYALYGVQFQITF
jgi:hypothetical protein